MTNTIEPGREVASRPGTLLQVRGAVKDYPGQRALDHMDFDLRVGEVHALLGENGAGKSTLIKAVAGVIPLTDGTVLMDGVEVDMRNPQRAQGLGVSDLQEPRLRGADPLPEGIELGADVRRGDFLDPESGGRPLRRPAPEEPVGLEHQRQRRPHDPLTQCRAR